jgi:twitching motility two-component system response regulator PilH
MPKILVVEDSQAQREVIVSLLKRDRFEITTAQNGLEAIAQAKLIHPDVVILDIIMPGMNGFEVCRKLRDSPETGNISIVMCSSKSTLVDRHWGFKQGANAYVAKPFSAKDLIDTIRKLLNRNKR